MSYGGFRKLDKTYPRELLHLVPGYGQPQPSGGEALAKAAVVALAIVAAIVGLVALVWGWVRDGGWLWALLIVAGIVAAVRFWNFVSGIRSAIGNGSVE